MTVWLKRVWYYPTSAVNCFVFVHSTMTLELVAKRESSYSPFHHQVCDLRHILCPHFSFLGSSFKGLTIYDSTQANFLFLHFSIIHSQREPLTIRHFCDPFPISQQFTQTPSIWHNSFSNSTIILTASTSYKAGYTATQVASGWAGSVIYKAYKAFGQQQWRQSTQKKHITDKPTDQLTNRTTN